MTTSTITIGNRVLTAIETQRQTSTGADIVSVRDDRGYTAMVYVYDDSSVCRQCNQSHTCGHCRAAESLYR